MLCGECISMLLVVFGYLVVVKQCLGVCLLVGVWCLFVSFNGLFARFCCVYFCLGLCLIIVTLVVLIICDFACLFFIVGYLWVCTL